jgi:HAD superfamily hydrolase (TIGR01458 family)
VPETPRALLLDLDGTVYEGDRAIPGVAEALTRLRARDVPLRFVTNTTRLPRRGLAARLGALGVAASADEMLTAPRAAVDWLRGHGIRRVALYVAAAAHEEFAEFEVTSDRPEAVVVGDLGADWTFERLNDAFRALLDGARLVAIQKNRYWSTGGTLTLDAGPFVAALEYAAATEATLVGKPSAAFFAAAARSLGLPPAAIAMVGDDVDGDVAGAQRAGLRAVLVRTGKYRSGDEARGGARPDAVLASAAALPAWLE